MAMERWNPWREMMTLREAMDRLFEDSFVRPGSTWIGSRSAGADGRGWFPLDVKETGDQIEVRASIPGVKPEDVQITVHGDTLTIRGESKAEEERKDENWDIREHRAGSFQRVVTLPTPVKSEQAEAHMEHGTLTLRLPKAEEARPRQIKIGGGATRQLEAAPGAAPRAVEGQQPEATRKAA
jgi:HSP20 family protein